MKEKSLNRILHIHNDNEAIVNLPCNTVIPSLMKHLSVFLSRIIKRFHAVLYKLDM